MQEVKNDKKEEKNLVNQDVASDGKNNKLPIMDQDDDENGEFSDARNQEKPKIYLVELMFIFPIVIIADIVDYLVFTGGAIPIVIMVSMLSTGITTLWLFLKKRRVGWNLIANIVDLIPALSFFPIKTLTLIILLMLESKRGKRIVYKAAEIVDKKNLLTKK